MPQRCYFILCGSSEKCDGSKGDMFQDVLFVVKCSYFHMKTFHIFLGHKAKLSMLVITPEKTNYYEPK